MSACAWEYSIERAPTPWSNPRGDNCHSKRCTDPWGYIARDHCRGYACGRERAHALRRLLCEGHAREWCKLFGVEFPEATK